MRAALRRRDEWSAERLAQHQRQALAALRRHAYARSPFYRRHHAGMTTARLEEIPPVTKIDLMGHWDADRDHPGSAPVRPGGSTSQPDRARGQPGRAVAAAVGRRDGQPQVDSAFMAYAGLRVAVGCWLGGVVNGRRCSASYARATDWAGVPAGLTRAAADGRRLLPRTSPRWCERRWPPRWCRRCGWTRPPRWPSRSRHSTALDHARWSGTPRPCGPLAGAQLAGALRISPQAVMSASEVLPGRRRRP